jgi:leucyl aminopeptidase
MSSTVLRASNSAVLAIPVATGPAGDGLQPRFGTADAAARYGVNLADLAERRHFTGAAGTSLVIDLPVGHTPGESFPWEGLTPRIVLVGVGDETPSDLRRAGAAIASATAGQGTVVTTVGAGDPDLAQAMVEGYLLGSYAPHRDGVNPPAPAHGDLVALGRFDREAVRRAASAAQATWLARDLTAWPSANKTPAAMAAVATALTEETPGLTIEVWEPERLATDGFGAILAVGGGAASGRGPDGSAQWGDKPPARNRRTPNAIGAGWLDRSPRLAVVRYTPPDASATTPHIAIVGKGVTFDTGGLDLKPRMGMETMKTDMAGAAVALATVTAAAREGLPVRVTAVMPLAENGMGAGSSRPGDVVTTYSGRTVEVGDTDAEGRMVLADGLAYADRELAPDVIIDVATLTGSARMALGRETGVFYATENALADRFADAGARAGEPWWRLPLNEDYRASLSSTIADVSSVPTEEVGAGSITAALFLQEFAGDRTWAHLDIAGPARAAKKTDLTAAGATGFAVRTLIRLIGSLG